MMTIYRVTRRMVVHQDIGVTRHVNHTIHYETMQQANEELKELLEDKTVDVISYSVMKIDVCQSRF